ncbi:hypothetical protein PYCC9005_000811 [Savitreella phatthalungensis]
MSGESVARLDAATTRGAKLLFDLRTAILGAASTRPSQHELLRSVDELEAVVKDLRDQLSIVPDIKASAKATSQIVAVDRDLQAKVSVKPDLALPLTSIEKQIQELSDAFDATQDRLATINRRVSAKMWRQLQEDSSILKSKLERLREITWQIESLDLVGLTTAEGSFDAVTAAIETVQRSCKDDHTRAFFRQQLGLALAHEILLTLFNAAAGDAGDAGRTQACIRTMLQLVASDQDLMAPVVCRAFRYDAIVRLDSMISMHLDEATAEEFDKGRSNLWRPPSGTRLASRTPLRPGLPGRLLSGRLHSKPLEPSKIQYWLVCKCNRIAAEDLDVESSALRPDLQRKSTNDADSLQDVSPVPLHDSPTTGHEDEGPAWPEPVKQNTPREATRVPEPARAPEVNHELNFPAVSSEPSSDEASASPSEASEEELALQEEVAEADSDDAFAALMPSAPTTSPPGHAGVRKGSDASSVDPAEVSRLLGLFGPSKEEISGENSDEESAGMHRHPDDDTKSQASTTATDKPLDEVTETAADDPAAHELIRRMKSEVGLGSRTSLPLPRKASSSSRSSLAGPQLDLTTITATSPRSNSDRGLSPLAKNDGGDPFETASIDAAIKADNNKTLSEILREAQSALKQYHASELKETSKDGRQRSEAKHDGKRRHK